MKVKNHPQLYYSSLLSFTVLLPSSFTRGMFLSALLSFTILHISPIQVDKSLTMCVWFLSCVWASRIELHSATAVSL